MTNDKQQNPCSLCGGSLLPGSGTLTGAGPRINCLNCGDHVFSTEALKDLPGINGKAVMRARLAFGVRKLSENALVTSEFLQSLAKAEEALPGALEQLDLLVRYLADSFPPGVHRDLHASGLRATLGAVTPEQVRWIVTEALHLRLIDGVKPSVSHAEWTLSKAVLTMDGWKRYTELMRAGVGSRHAFMAMKFGDSEMEWVYRDHMRLAVRQAGFDLRTTNEDHATAGSIDNRMRVEIRTSRFVVCDLTHGNRGAYWEAGFAEGLGRPVFYTCRRDVLEDRQHADHPHFDTAHQLIVAWDASDPSSGMHDLKNVIRATIPAEARMEDA